LPKLSHERRNDRDVLRIAHQKHAGLGSDQCAKAKADEEKKQTHYQSTGLSKAVHQNSLSGQVPSRYAAISNDEIMTSQTKAKNKFAKIMAAACVRRGYLENLHAGITPVSRKGDYSDVKVVDAEGREIPWNQVSRINQAEMKTLMTGVVNRIYTFLTRTLFSATQDKEFEEALDRVAGTWTKAWEEPKYLTDFLMPRSDKQE
jgi:hypothetical protein